MKYLVTLKPLEPFLFGGDHTFGELGDNYIVHSRMFPQQTALLGMMQKEILLQAGILTRKRKGEWVDKKDRARATELVGGDKFDLSSAQEQSFGNIEHIGAVFLKQGSDFYIKKADIDRYSYNGKILQGYDPKDDIFDNFISVQNRGNKKGEDIFQEVKQIGNKKGGEQNSLFRKTSYLLKDNFTFAFFLESSFELIDGFVCLGADRSCFKMKIEKDTSISLEYEGVNDHLVLLSDSFIATPVESCCEYAIASEISFRHLKPKRVKKDGEKDKNIFAKSDTVYFYEKGSLFVSPTQKLINDLVNANLRKVGFNQYTYQAGEK